MNAPQRQIARITFERRHAPQNPLWNARPRSTRQKRIAVYQVERKSEKRSGLKKNHTERRDGGEKSTNNRVTSMPRNSTHFWQTILPRYFSRRPFFHCLFSRLSCFCLLFYFFFVFFLIWDCLAEALEWDLFSLFVITTATIVGLYAAVWANWIFSVYLNKWKKEKKTFWMNKNFAYDGRKLIKLIIGFSFQMNTCSFLIRRVSRKLCEVR